MVDEEVEVAASDEVAEDFYLVRLRAPRIAADARPGQFVNVRVSDTYAPFLRLPLSICSADVDAGAIELLYEDMGPKSQCLSRLQQGARLRCLGPLGNSFGEPPQGARALLVGGGIGVPPLLFWGRLLRRRGLQAALLVGARSAAKHLPDALLAPAAQQVRRATDDGSLGRRGLVTDLLREELEKGGPCQVYTCGPHAMMRAVAALCAERDIACQASLEEYMACGYGVCIGCVVGVKGARGEADYGRYRRICVDGPVFDADQVRWEP